MKSAIPALLVLALAPAALALEGVVVHRSQCHPGGSSTYPVGDTILFEYVTPAEPREDAYYFAPCGNIRFEAESSGKPPLSHVWRLDGAPLAKTGTQQVVEVSAAAFRPGPHLLELEVTNPHGSSVLGYPFYLVDLADSPPLLPARIDAGAGPLTIVLRAEHPAAGQWRWSFGDGHVSPWFTPCPGSVSTVVHTYDAPGEYDVLVEARNCRGSRTAPRPLRVVVGSSADLLTTFLAEGCLEGTLCVFSPGEPVTFAVSSTTEPVDRYRWDWDGDGVIDEESSGPITHSFPAGLHQPAVTLIRGKRQSTMRHWVPLVVR